jgi:hypothetical protein
LTPTLSKKRITSNCRGITTNREKGMRKTGTPWDVGWNRLLNGDSTPAAATSAAARGGDFLVAARGCGRLCAEDFFGSILGDGWKGGGG